MRLLIVSLSTYTSPYFRGQLDSLAPCFGAAESGHPCVADERG